MNGTATREPGPNDIIDEVRYLNDLGYRRRIHADLEIEGDEPIDLGPPSDEDLVFESMEAVGKFLDDLLEEALRDRASAENLVYSPSA
jgi:hypothetical protein